MRKDTVTYSYEKFESRRFWTVIVLICFVLNVINCFGVQLFYNYEVSGNVSYKAFQSFFENLIRFLDIAVIFAGYSVICRAVLSLGFAKALKYYAAVGVTMTIPYIAGIVITKATTAEGSINYGLLAFYSFFSFILDLCVLLAVAAVALIVRRMALKKMVDPLEAPAGFFELRTPVMLVSFLISVGYSAVLTVQSVITTCDLIKTYGGPVNVGEILTLATPYFEHVVFFLVQYCIMIALMYYFRRPEGRA